MERLSEEWFNKNWKSLRTLLVLSKWRADARFHAEELFLIEHYYTYQSLRGYVRRTGEPILIRLIIEDKDLRGIRFSDYYIAGIPPDPRTLHMVEQMHRAHNRPKEETPLNQLRW